MPDAPAAKGSSRHALIVGAGIGGLAAALFLVRAGWRVTLAERETALHEVGAGLQLSPNATRLLVRLGLMADFTDLAVRPQEMVVRRHDGRVLARPVLGKAAEALFGAPFLVIHRGDLQKILRQRAEKTAGIEIHLGLRLADLRETPEDVTGIFESAEGTETRITADLLVGADGLWSRVRPLSGLPHPSLPQGKTAWRGLIPREAAPIFAREAKVNLWLGPNAHLVHYPVSGGEAVNVVAIIDEAWLEEGWNAPGDPDVMARLFTRWGEDARALIAASPGWNRWALIDRAPESRWSRGRITLLGDAAHAMLPFLAQGASQAIEDGASLAAHLGAAGAGSSLAAALAHYDRARISRSARVQSSARAQGRIYHLAGPLAAARDATLRLLPRNAVLQRYGWIYDHDAERLKS
jgi:salicylate hydroxylase